MCTYVSSSQLSPLNESHETQLNKHSQKYSNELKTS